MRLSPGVVLTLAITVTGPAHAAEPQALYATTCVACHGPAGKGALPGVPDLATRLGKSDAELAARFLNGLQSPVSPIAF